MHPQTTDIETDEALATTPAVFDKYRVVMPLASGGMADVFLADARGPAGTHKLVVVKRMRPTLAQDPLFQQMFMREARVSLRLDHPNIVQTHEVAQQDGAYLLAMEYLEGQPLTRVAAQSRLIAGFDSRHWVRVACDALAGLAHAHAIRDLDGRPLEVVHRDVSPQNIFVTYDGHVKILDFGIAKASWGAYKTHAGILKGKLAYMAPEQARGEKVDARADVFAMGTVLWELLAGRRLFAAGNNAETMHRLLVLPIPPLSAATEVDPRLESIVHCAISRDRDARFETADAMRNALENYLASSGPPVRSSDLAEVLTKLFGAERSEDRGAIVRKLKDLAHEDRETVPPTPDASTLPPPAPRASTRPPPRESIAPSIPPVSAPIEHALTASIPPPRPRKRGAMAMLGVTAVVAAAIPASLLYARSRASSTAAAPPNASAVAEVAPTPAAASCPAGMALVPGGAYFMGSDEGPANERPAHKVTLAAFCIDDVEVTTAAYQACSDRGQCRRAYSTNEWPGITDHERAALDPLCNVRQREGRAEHPINCVDADRARDYCAAHDKRLPTEAEWELAARGPDGRKYPWGDAEPTREHLNGCGAECAAWSAKSKLTLRAALDDTDGFATTSPAGSFPKGASPYGAKDLVGNVWEWVADFDGPYGAGAEIDPRGPGAGDARVLRGGSFTGTGTTTMRHRAAASARRYDVGFRCASKPGE